MMKFSQTPRRSILALVAVATLNSVFVTDASAGGFVGGAFGGGRSFGGINRGLGSGAQLGGVRQASLPTAIHAPVGGIRVPSGAGPQLARVPRTTPATPPGATPVVQPTVPRLPPGQAIVPRLPPGQARVPRLPPGQATVPALPPGQATGPRLPPVQSPPPPPAGNPNLPTYPANPNPPAYPPAAGGDGGTTISVGLVGALVGDPVTATASGTVAVQTAPVSYTPVSGPACDRFLPNACYLAMRKYSTPNGGAELRCTMICE